MWLKCINSCWRLCIMGQRVFLLVNIRKIQLTWLHTASDYSHNICWIFQPLSVINVQVHIADRQNVLLILTNIITCQHTTTCSDNTRVGTNMRIYLLLKVDVALNPGPPSLYVQFNEPCQLSGASPPSSSLSHIIQSRMRRKLSKKWATIERKCIFKQLHLPD